MNKKKNKQKNEGTSPIIKQIPGFSNQFKDDLKWWFKTDSKKASLILFLVVSIMNKPQQLY